MSPEAQRITILEMCPELARRNNVMSSIVDLNPIDPLSDLNAMHEAEKTLDDRNRECRNYAETLTRTIAQQTPGSMDPSRFGLIHATAAQRAEAFIRTLGKWQE